MPKSLMYIPGLAVPQLVVKQAKTPQAFKAKVLAAFRGDQYMDDMVDTIQNKGAIPADCRQSLHWLEIPKETPAIPALPQRKANMGKALGRLGPQWADFLSPEAGKAPQPMKMSVGVSLPSCNAPEFMAQPMPSSSKTKALADVKAGDTLYIIGHSNALGGSLTYKCPALGHITQTPGAPDRPGACTGWQHFEKRHIDPVTLASLLINEGLRAGVTFDIAMVACFSGGLDNKELQTVQTFAGRLAGTLSARGYRCRVYGATGLTSSGDGMVRAAMGATKLPDGTILLDQKRTDLPDKPGQPFYRRFFRLSS